MSAMETIDDALATADPVRCNLRITLARRELSIGLHERLGPDSGANKDAQVAAIRAGRVPDGPL